MKIRRILTIAILTTLLFNSCDEEFEPFPAEFIVYPNPFSHTFNLLLNVPENAHVEIRIVGTDIKSEFESGKKPESSEGGLSLGLGGVYKDMSFEPRDIPSGVYFLDVSVNGTSKRMKIVKQ